MPAISQRHVEKQMDAYERIKTEGEKELKGLDLEQAIAAHEAWKTKLELTLRGKNPEEYDPAILGADHLCVLGKWIHSEGAALEHIPEFVSLRDAHARFHACAGKILTLHKQGDLADAIAMLRRKLPDLSDEVQTYLVRLSQKVS